METTKELVNDWLKIHVAGLAPASQIQYTSAIQNIPDLAPTIDDFSAKIFRREFRRMKDHPTKANRWKAVLSSFCSWLVEEEYLEYNPAIGMKKYPEKPKTRFLTDRDLTDLGGVMLHSQVDPHTLACIRLMLSTGVRLSEAIGIRWDEVHIQTDGSAEWHIPAERTKADRPLFTWLSPRLVLELRLLDSFNLNDRTGFVLRSPSDHRNRLGYHTPGQTLRRLCKRMDMTEFSPHDLRRTVGTQLARLGVQLDIRKAVLNHASSGVTNIHYNQYDYWPEKVAALKTLEQLLIDTEILPSAGRNVRLLAS